MRILVFDNERIRLNNVWYNDLLTFEFLRFIIETVASVIRGKLLRNYVRTKPIHNSDCYTAVTNCEV